MDARLNILKPFEDKLLVIRGIFSKYPKRFLNMKVICSCTYVCVYFGKTCDISAD